MSQPVCCVEVIGFGCRLNSLESDAVRQAAEAAPRARDLIVFNTCAVTMEAGRQARQSIRRAARAKPDAEIVVTGCGAQVAAQDYAAMPEVSRVVGNVEKLRPEQWLAQPAAPRVAVGDIMAAQGPLQPLPVSERAARTRGFVQGADGVRPSLHFLHHSFRARRLTIGIGRRHHRARADPCRNGRVGRRSDGRRYHRFRGWAWRFAPKDPLRGARAAAAALVLDRLHRGGRRSCRSIRGRAAPDAASASVAAIGR